jgi:hypothetical protein
MADFTSTSTTGLPNWMQPYAAGYLNQAQTVANSPYQQYTGQMTADMTPWQQQGLQAQAQRGMSGSPVMGAANQQLQNTIQGGFVGSNPYLDQQIGQAQGDLVKSWNTVAKPQWDTAMSRSGSFGNSGVMEANANAQGQLQQNLGRISTDMRGNAYNFERGNQQQAMSMAPAFAANDYQDINALQQAGQAYQNQNQRGLDDNYKQFLESRAYPQQQLDTFGKALGTLNWGTNQTQTQPGPSGASQLVGGALTGSALYNMLFGGG